MFDKLRYERRLIKYSQKGIPMRRTIATVSMSAFILFGLVSGASAGALKIKDLKKGDGAVAVTGSKGFSALYRLATERQKIRFKC